MVFTRVVDESGADGWDWVEASLRPVEDTNPLLASRMRATYVQSFLGASGVDARLSEEIRSGVAFEAGSSPSGQLVLRVRHPLGCGVSLFDWDGSDDDAFEVAQSSGVHAGDNLADDVLEWPQDWHPRPERDLSMWAVRSDLAIAMREAFLDAFFAESRLSERRRTEAVDMLRIHQEAFANGTRILRFMFDFLGATQWWEWDGSDEDAIVIAMTLGETSGQSVRSEQRHGPTGWEPEFDNQIDPQA